MDAAGVDRLLALLRASPGVRELDITGGAPEMNPHFRRLVVGARALGLQVIDRCNLTVLFEPGQADLAAFLAEQGVRVVASLPCYTAATVDKQRGDGVFDRSIAALRELNAAGYATSEHEHLTLDLMYNPAGASLPPAAETLEAAYKRELAEHFGVSFSRLLTLTNMPIKRFADRLHQAGQTEAYMATLLGAFNPEAARRVMVRSRYKHRGALALALTSALSILQPFSARSWCRCGGTARSSAATSTSSWTCRFKAGPASSASAAWMTCRAAPSPRTCTALAAPLAPARRAAASWPERHTCAGRRA